MRAALVRVGIDQAYGGWNAPMDPATNAFLYVPIPEESACGPGLSTPYRRLDGDLAAFAEQHRSAEQRFLRLPPELADRSMHLDPDFESLTYGDNGTRRGKGLCEFQRGDLVVFYASLRPVHPCEHRLVYAVIGVLWTAEAVRLSDVPSSRWAENAHSRRRDRVGTDIIIRGEPGRSGRFRRCLPIGEWRRRSYRVRRDLLDAWGDLSCRDGFIQRSAVPPSFRSPERFAAWLDKQKPDLLRANNPEPIATRGHA